MKKIISIVGARPQFVKASTISKVFARYSNQFDELIVHTGQHFDPNMSEIFFKQLSMPTPKYNLNISNLSHGAMTGRMLERIENILIKESPEAVIVYGDTNSTLSGALASVKLHIPLIHIEAGLRAFDLQIPEEVNRVLVDKISSVLFCPTDQSVNNLTMEGIKENVFQVGDVMYDATLNFTKIASLSYSLKTRKLEESNYVLCTIHRAETTNDLEKLHSVCSAINMIAKEMKVIFPMHPRTQQAMQHIKGYGNILSNVIVVEPLSFFEMLFLESKAFAIITDSGGVQKEAFFHKIPCITLRDRTEWEETVQLGWNEVVGTKESDIVSSWSTLSQRTTRVATPYGTGNAAEKIVNFLEKLI
jgi:UDP-GlcNAc3NAcA epimerase